MKVPVKQKTPSFVEALNAAMQKLNPVQQAYAAPQKPRPAGLSSVGYFPDPDIGADPGSFQDYLDFLDGKGNGNSFVNGVNTQTASKAEILNNYYKYYTGPYERLPAGEPYHPSGTDFTIPHINPSPQPYGNFGVLK